MRSDTVNIGFFGPEPAAPIHEAVALLRERDDFLILCHQKPDGDTVGSAFAPVSYTHLGPFPLF